MSRILRQRPGALTLVLFSTLLMTRCGGNDVVADVADDGPTPPSNGGDEESIGASGDSNGPGNSGGFGGSENEGADGAAGAPGAPGDPLSLTREQFCAGSGPVVNVGQTGTGGAFTGDVCTGRIAEQLFRFALCSCTNVLAAGDLATDSFDSRNGPYAPGQAGGAVGVNNDFGVMGQKRVGGTLIMAGATAMEFFGDMEILGDLKTNGDLNFRGSTHVSRDVWVRGSLTGFGEMQIERDLHRGTGAGLPPPADLGVGGQTFVEDFTIPKPCACEPDQLLDIPAVVERVAHTNDNAEVGLDPNSLSSVIEFGRIEELPCGRFYLQNVAVFGDLTLRINERTAIFVGGDFNVAGDFSIDVGPEGELDLFIAGNLVLLGDTSFGNKDRPGASRIYVGNHGGPGVIDIRGDHDFVSNLYAPLATVKAMGDIEIYGSLFAGSFEGAGDIDIHYDRWILEVGEDCGDRPPPGDVCISSGGPCQSDDDCCEPLVCDNGSCGPLLPPIE